MPGLVALPTMLATDLFVARLDAAIEGAPHAANLALLSPRETARADRYRSPGDRARFVASRALLRRLLARYVARAPEAVAIELEPRGRPYVGARPSFSVSHAAGLLLVGVRPEGGRIGVDLEPLDQSLAAVDLARRFFAPEEASAVAAAPATFFQYWTLKEAYTKALGIGLLADLAKCPFILGPEPRLATSDGSSWAFRSFEPAPGFVAAVAVDRNR